MEKKMLEKMDKKCSMDFLKEFGIVGPPNGEARKATTEEKSYCVRNYYTCCTEEDFNSMRKSYTA